MLPYSGCAFFRNIQHSTNSTIRFRRGSKDCCEKPFPAQTIAIMGLVKRWQQARTGMVVAECGTGKTLISLGAIHVHSEGKPSTSLAMVPPHLVEKWARETFLTVPGIRVFLVDDLRNGGDENKSHGVNEVRLQAGPHRAGRHAHQSERTAVTERIVEFPETLAVANAGGLRFSSSAVNGRNSAISGVMLTEFHAQAHTWAAW